MMETTEISVITVTNPRSEELFHRIATPPEVLKANKSTSQVLCSTCFTTRHKLLACQRCKSVWYCSKECQKKNWPRHKLHCAPSERPKGMKNLVYNVACNNILFSMLRVCAAIDLDLVNDKKKIGFKFPFMIRVDIAVEPCDLASFLKLYLADEPIEEKMQGMVQFNHFYSHIPGQSGFAPLTETRDNMWRKVREELDQDPDSRKDPLGLLEFVNNDGHLSITMPIQVHDAALYIAKKKKPFEIYSVVTGRRPERPMTVNSCLEFMNIHVRADKQNQLKLRAEMTDADKAIVQSVRDQNCTKQSVVFLREKMARELNFEQFAMFSL